MVDFKEDIVFDRALFQENITKGQRVERAKLESWNGNDWQLISEFTTVGYKRLLRFEKTTTRRVRLTILAAKAPVLLAEIGFFNAKNE